MRLTVQVEIDDDALAGENGGAELELARLLREVAEIVEEQGQPQAGVWVHLREDINGIRVGDWGFLEEER